MSDQPHFENQMLGEFTPDPLAPYAVEYHERCEAYDRTVCTGERDGIAMPQNGRESAMINRNSREVRAELTERIRRELGNDYAASFPAAIRSMSPHFVRSMQRHNQATKPRGKR